MLSKPSVAKHSCSHTQAPAVGALRLIRQLAVPNTLCRSHATLPAEREAAAGSGTAAAAAAAEAFKAWFLQHAAPVPTLLDPVVVDSSGRHRMLAGQEVAGGSLLLQVPERLLLSANTAVASKHCGRLVREAELSEWQALVLHLLTERAAGPDSFWAPYLAVLGDQATHPLLWGEDLQQQLAGSAMLRTLVTRLQQVQEDTDLLISAGANQLPIAQAWQQQQQEPLVTLHSVCWAAAVLLGRSFSLDLSEPELPCEGDMSYFGSWQAHGPASLVLVPWADMCQHSSDAGAEAMLMFDPEARAALLSADRPYSPGQEVFDSHGPGLSWADLVMDHGCVVEGQHDHPRYDAVMSGHMKPRGSRNAALLAALETLTGQPPTVSLTPHGPDPMGLAVLRAGLASDAELIQAGWRTGSTAADVGQCARVMARLGQPKSLGTEQRVVGVLQAAVEGCLGGYPTSLQQDQTELQPLTAAAAAAAAAGADSAQQQQQQQQGGFSQQGTKQQQGGVCGGGDAAAASTAAAAAAAAAVSASAEQLIRVAMLKGLVSEKAALVGCLEVLGSWQQQLAGLKGAVKPEQIAAIYAHGEDSEDDS